VAITQLAANGTNPVSRPTNSGTDSISLLAGSNRLFVVYIAARDVNASGGAPAETQPTVTYGGVTMELMVRSGDAAQSFLSVASGSGRTYGMLFYLRESQLPANGAQNLVISWPGLSGSSQWAFRAMSWQFANCDQGATVRDHRRFSNTGASPVGGSLQPGGTSDAILVGSTNGAASGTTEVEIAGAPQVEDINTTVGAVARISAAKQLAAGVVVTILTQMLYSVASGGAVLIAARLAEFFVPQGSVELADEPAGSAFLELQ